MSRFTGPRVKVMRALGLELPGLSRKSIERRPYPPGEHGGRRRRRDSVFGLQLKEKQKLKMNYGVSEKQMRRLIKQARRSKQETGLKLIELLERRLDNVVFRAGYAPTIPAARQLVNHGHFRVNGRKVDVPSFCVGEGDIIELKPKSAKLKPVEEALEQLSLTRPEWVTFDAEARKTTVQGLPASDSVPFEIDVQQVVEYYARRL
ncbi:MAG: 30S ribosomal protein S4 [Myxococcota bacterium]|nr:30S ribosomal protein S4 [Myxococcota bacterium]